MEEYLRNMRSLRTQMNDFEEEAASTTAEEEKQRTAILAMEKDLESVRLETKDLIQEADELTKRNAQLRCQILEKQKKISSLEIESATLSQTLELLHKEFDTLQEKVKEERIYYEKVAKEMNSNLQGQQDWINSHKLEKTSSAISVKDIGEKLLDHSEGSLSSELPSAEEMARAKVDSASAKLDELNAKTSEVSLDTVELKQRIAQFQLKTEGFPCEIKTAETKILEEEHQALLTDKGGELEYLQSLQERIGLFLAISEEVKCPCGRAYSVHLSDYSPHSKSGSG